MMRMRLAVALFLVRAAALAQGSIPGLTSTPITFSGHADAFVAGPDGNVWIVDSTANAIGRLAVDGSAYQTFPVPTAAAGLNSIVAGPDGNLWFTESSVSKVGRITTSGAITEFTVPAPFVYVLFGFVNLEGTIAAGPDGNLWISGSGQMARVTPQGAVTVLSVASPPGGDLFEIGKCVAGPDANLWCLSSVRIAGEFDNHPVKVTTAGVATLYPGFFGQYFDIVSAPDGNLWISAQGTSPPESLTRVTPAGVETVYALPTKSSSTVAVGADGNIWFAEDATSGRLWQMILSSATDDGLATFNTAPTVSYPIGIVAVPSPETAGCKPGAAFYLSDAVSFGENLTWVKTPKATECADLVAEAQYLRFQDPLGSNGNVGCSVTGTSPNPAMNVTMTIKVPNGGEAGFGDTGEWTCPQRPQGTVIQCKTPMIAPGHELIIPMGVTGVFVGGSVKCASDTPEINPENDETEFGQPLEIILAKPIDKTTRRQP